MLSFFNHRIIQNMSQKDNKYCQSDSSIEESIRDLETINQALDEDSLCNREFIGMSLSIKMKGLLLLGLSKRNLDVDKNNKKKILYKWYVNSNNQKHELAINKLITSGKITTFKFLYKIKIFAKKILTIANEDEASASITKVLSQQSLRKSKQMVVDPNNIPKSGQAQKPRSSRWSKRVSLPKQNSPKLVASSHRRQKSDNLPTIQYKKSQVFQEKKGNLNQKEEIRELLKQQARKLRIMKALDTLQKNKEASIKKIITENQEQIVTRNEKQKINSVMHRTDMGQEISIISDKRNYLGNGKDSISYIDPISGELRIDLITCTNIFDNSNSHQEKTNSKATSVIEVLRVVQKIKIKLVNLGFRKLLENMMEQDYEEQLLKAKRNLQLVEQNFMIDCQMDSIVQNFQQQTQHFESIDKSIQTLKQKFMYSRAVCLLRVLRKLFLSNLRKFFCSHNDQTRTHKSRRSFEQQLQDNIYEVQELVHASSTSLSNGTSSGAFLRYIEQQESICFNNNAFKIGSLSQALKHQQKQLDK